jgi:hypothetical protein
MQNLQNSTIRALDALDIKICLHTEDDTAIKRIPARINSFAALKAIARTMCDKNGVDSARNFKINYKTEENEAIDVEDDADLEVAYAIALSVSSAVKFNIVLAKQILNNIQPVGQSKIVEPVPSPKIVTIVENAPMPMPVSVPIEEQINMLIEEKEKDEEVKGKKGKCGGKKGNGVPRKALKSLIQHEMEKQSRNIFQQIMRDHKFAVEDQQPVDEEGAPVKHTNVACDSCGVNPILGVRYKCSVCKDFDYCTECEERQDHEHPFLKIKKNNGAPAVMITVLNEDDNAEELPDHGHFHGPHHGRRHGPHGHGPHGGPHGRHGGPHGGSGHAFKTMVTDFMGKMGVTVPEELQKEAWSFMGGKRCGMGGEKPWKKKRAVVVSKPEGILEACPGQMLLPAI